MRRWSPPATRLAHAVALSYSGEPSAALVRIDVVLESLPVSLRSHGFAARSDLLLRTGRARKVEAAVRQAVAHAPTAAAWRLFARKLASCRAGDG